MRTTRTARAARLVGVIALIGVLTSACGASQSAEQLREQEAREDALMRYEARARWTPPVLLWQVSDAGGERAPSWLLATLPFGATLPSALPAPHDEVLEQARSVVIDVDPSVLDLEFLAERHPLPRRERLDRLLGAGAYAALEAIVGQRLPAARLRAIEPWVASLHVTRVRMAEAEADAEGRRRVAGAVSSSSMVHELAEVARRRGLTLAELDADPTVYLQDLQVIARPHWVLALQAQLEQPDWDRERARALREAYESRDEARIAEACGQVNENDADATRERRTLLGVRAQRWLPDVEAALRRGGTLVAIDVCSVVPDNGLLSLLYGTGLHVQRLGAPAGTERP